MTGKAPSFDEDIRGIFSDFYRSSMRWRFDLWDYDDVKASAQTVYDLISTGQMPPPEFGSISPENVALFKKWMDTGYAK